MVDNRVPYHKPEGSFKLALQRLLYSLRYTGRHWSDSFAVSAIGGLLVYTAIMYGTIYWRYGEGYPLNRFQWRRKKARGQLSDELLEKEELVQTYLSNKFHHLPKKPSPVITQVFVSK